MKKTRMITAAFIAIMAASTAFTGTVTARAENVQDNETPGNIDWGDEEKEYAWQVYAITDWQSVQNELVFNELKSGAEAINISTAVESYRDLIAEVVLDNYSTSKFPKVEYVDFAIAILQILYDKGDSNNPMDSLEYLNPGDSQLSDEGLIKLLLDRIFACEQRSADGDIKELDAELEAIAQGVVLGSNYVTENQSYTKSNADAYAAENGMSGQPTDIGQLLENHYKIVNINGAVSGEFVHPIPDYSQMTSPFGWRTHPISGTRKHHNGIDWAAPTGTPIYAIADGVVSVSSFQSGGAGLWASIDHGDGVISTYMHNSEVFVSAGDTVKAGELIALCGSTGGSTGPHLHFEIAFDGVRVDPAIYFW